MNKGVHHVQQHGFRTMPDKREVCDKSSAGRREYKQRREDAWDRDKGICILCEQFVPLEAGERAGRAQQDQRLRRGKA